MQIGFVEYNSDKTETLICFVKLFCFLANRKHCNFETDSQDEAKTYWVFFNWSTEKGPAEVAP